MAVNQWLLVLYVLGINHATTTIVAQSGFPQSSGFREGLTDSSELPVHKVLKHVRVQLNVSDRGAFHEAVYSMVSAEKQGTCNSAPVFTDVYMYIDNTVCSTLNIQVY